MLITLHRFAAVQQMHTKNKNTKGFDQPESVADFKLRLSAMLRQSQPERFIKTDRPCVRKPTDSGYYPPAREVGSGQRTIQQDDSTVIVERRKGGAA
jgi:hypothetical protein